MLAAAAAAVVVHHQRRLRAAIHPHIGAVRLALPAPGLSSATGVSSACSTALLSIKLFAATASGSSRSPPMPIHDVRLERGMRTPESA